MRNSVEKRKQKLINKLVFFNVYDKEDKQLNEMSLSKLEYEYRRFKLQSHPHGEFSSIQWI
ncbi:Fur-regulated basic protein FbpA [Neobacillus mesonae]|uniref:Fur-regulated basic protein FbpA n=1 Tax=Neobacillus mesonae TaxID=1193713 RepID=UPI0025725189|nr:Fur-regulated basic protein FbpA [Neobacillus mesonae]MED4205882.1 Fur-regulated basic protein FbpA [Neobacillus mesonae]